MPNAVPPAALALAVMAARLLLVEVVAE